MYYKQLCGEKCYLSPIDVNDAETYCLWLNDLSISLNLSAPMHLTPDVERDWIVSIRSGNNKVFGIINKESDALIGCCGLHEIDFINKTAMFGIFIGEGANQGRGFGSEATRLLVSYAFTILNLHNVYLSVFEFNQRAISVYQKVGFSVTGRRRQAKWLSNKYYDIVMMDVLNDEFSPIKLTGNIGLI